MPISVDRTSEVAVDTIFGDSFIKSLKQYLGLHHETPSDDLPIDVEELLHSAISITEQEQWRHILKKDVTLLLPRDAVNECDNLLFLPLGLAEEVTISYIDKEEDTQEFTDFTMLTGEPIRLYSKTWSDMYYDCNTDNPYPITVQYTPGYASYEEIPKSTIMALKVLCHHLFENRAGDTYPKAYGYHRDLAMLNDYRAIRYIADDWNKVNPR